MRMLIRNILNEIILKKIIKTLRKQHSDVEGNISAVEEKE